jgi:hypothetical protein
MKFIFLILLLTNFWSLSAQKVDKVVFKSADKDLHLVFLSPTTSLAISGDSLHLYIVEGQKVIYKQEFEPKNKIKKIVALNQTEISVNGSEKLMIFDLSKNNFKLTKEIPHNKFEIPLQNPVILQNFILGTSAIKNPEPGKQNYKYSFKDEYNVRDITLPLDVKTNYKFPMAAYSIYHAENKGLAYIFLPDASSICTFNLNNKKKRFFSLPEHDHESERWSYFYDHIEDMHYAVLVKKDNKHKLYALLDDFLTVSFIKDVNELPYFVMAGYLYNKSHDSKGETSHVLAPIYSHDESKTKTIDIK